MTWPLMRWLPVNSSEKDTKSDGQLEDNLPSCAPQKEFAKNKGYRKSLQSLNEKKGNHRSQKLSFVIEQTNWHIFLF